MSRSRKRMRPAVGPVEAGDAVEDGGLAGAVGADQPVDGARLDGEAHAVDGAQAPEAEGRARGRTGRRSRRAGRAGQQRRRHRALLLSARSAERSIGPKGHPPGRASAQPRSAVTLQRRRVKGSRGRSPSKAGLRRPARHRVLDDRRQATGYATRVQDRVHVPLPGQGVQDVDRPQRTDSPQRATQTDSTLWHPRYFRYALT